MGVTKDKVKEILLRRISAKDVDAYIPAESIEDIDADQKFKNFEEAVQVGYRKEEEYAKINPFRRFFSHFVPNSWTKAGQLRNEIKECDDAFKEVGYTKKDFDEYYRRSFGDDLYETQIIAKANKHFFAKTTEKELKNYAKENMIAEPLDLSEYVKDESIIEEEYNEEKILKEIEEIDSGILEEENEENLDGRTK